MLNTVSLGSGSLLSLSDAKIHLRLNITDGSEDSYITALIAAAQDLIQRETGIRFYADVYDQFWSNFPSNAQTLQLTRYPVASVTWIKYYDLSNTLQTWSTNSYISALPTNSPGWIEPVYNIFYPVNVRPRPDSVNVRYTTGFTTIPLAAVQACKLLVGSWYENRENEAMLTREMSYGIDRLLRQMDCRGYF